MDFGRQYGFAARFLRLHLLDGEGLGARSFGVAEKAEMMDPLGKGVSNQMHNTSENDEISSAKHQQHACNFIN